MRDVALTAASPVLSLFPGQCVLNRRSIVMCNSRGVSSESFFIQRASLQHERAYGTLHGILVLLLALVDSHVVGDVAEVRLRRSSAMFVYPLRNREVSLMRLTIPFFRAWATKQTRICSVRLPFASRSSSATTCIEDVFFGGILTLGSESSWD